MAYFGPTIVPHATYDEFRNAVLGNGYDMDGSYGPQCWDGADLIWYQYGLTLYTGPQGYAVECWTVSRSRNAVYPFTDIYTGPQGIRRGDISTSSFAFKVAEDKWEKRSDGSYLRRITKFSELYDVSPVYKEAYPDTSVALRKMKEIDSDELKEYYKALREGI